MKKLLFIVFIVLLNMTFYAQTVSVIFTGYNSTQNQYAKLNRVVVTDLTQNWQEIIYWPDTVLTMQVGTGIGEVEIPEYASLQLSQNNPNPFQGTTYATLTVAEAGDMTVEVSDVLGRVVVAKKMAFLQSGNYQFRVTLSTAGVYFLTVRMNGQISSIKMVNQGEGGKDAIELVDNIVEKPQGAFIQSPSESPKGNIGNPFQLDDQMEYVGFATINGSEVESEHVVQTQNMSQTITLQFTVGGLPCPEAATVTDIDNNTYNTVQIGNQCWMKENLRTTHYSDGTSIALGSSNSSTTAYRYAPNGISSNVNNYGYLYNWVAVMHGTSSSSSNPSGVQGICPTGWHVPSDAEFTQLTDYVSSQPQYQCNSNSANIAKALAYKSGWTSSSETCAIGHLQSLNNATGFSARPAGDFAYGYYHAFSTYICCWSTTGFTTTYNTNMAWYRYFNYNDAEVGRYACDTDIAYSVRCLRD